VETLPEDSRGIVLYWGEFSGESEFGKDLRYRLEKVVRIYYLLSFDLWTSYLTRIFFLKGCGSLFWEFSSSIRIFNELKHNFQWWK
jgi:hypothetical protein